MHLEIKLSTNSREDVANSVVEKLYDLLYENSNTGITRQLDDSSYIEGYINVLAAYQDKIEYLTTRRQTPYVYLNIDVIAAYIPFKETYVEQKLVNAGYGDGTGVTVTAAGLITPAALANLFKRDTTITSFDELKYFTGITSLDSLTFDSCTNLINVTLPSNCTSLGQDAFANCSSLSSVNIENVVYMGTGVFHNCTSFFVTDPIYFKSLKEPIRNNDGYGVDRNGLFAGKFQYIYAPKLEKVSGGYDAGGNNCRGLFMRAGYPNSMTSRNIVYFKDLNEVETGAFCGGIITHLIINNPVPPTVSQYNGSTTSYQPKPLLDVDSGIIRDQVLNVYVPDGYKDVSQNQTYVDYYKSLPYWSEFGSRIQPISNLNKVATKEQWDLLSDQDKQNTLIEEYMN